MNFSKSDERPEMFEASKSRRVRTDSPLTSEGGYCDDEAAELPLRLTLLPLAFIFRKSSSKNGSVKG